MGPPHRVQPLADAEMTRRVYLCRPSGGSFAVSALESTDRDWPLVMGWLQFAFGSRA